MKNLIVQNILNNKKNITPEFENSIIQKYNSYISYTQIPKVNLVQGIDIKNIPPKLNTLYQNCMDIIGDNYNMLVNLQTYKPAGFITSLLTNKYFENTISQDNHLNNILYIDTNLLIEDYKKLMDKNDSTSLNLVHSLDVLYKEVETADYIFWDKFGMLNSNYALTKIYNILDIRYRKCLGNMFFITGGKQTMEQKFSNELYDVMNLTLPSVINLEREQFTYIKEEF